MIMLANSSINNAHLIPYTTLIILKSRPLIAKGQQRYAAIKISHQSKLLCTKLLCYHGQVKAHFQCLYIYPSITHQPSGNSTCAPAPPFTHRHENRIDSAVARNLMKEVLTDAQVFRKFVPEAALTKHVICTVL